MEIREMKLGDMFGIAGLEQRIFADAWTVSSCRSTFENPNVYSVVAEDEDGICGYGFLMFAADEAEILRIAVDEEKRRRHIGSSILEDMLEYAAEEGFLNIYLEVRQGNMAAIGMYQDAGFEPVGRRTQYYSDPDEDALIMELVFEDEEGDY